MSDMIVRNRSLILLFFLSLFGCVDPIDVKLDQDVTRQLVVEGWIDDVNDLVVVRLSTSTINGVGENTLGGGARVTISTGSGEIFLLEEAIPGVYATLSESVRGVVGESYQLNIESGDGRMYESTMETLPNPVSIGLTQEELIETRGTTDDGTPFVSYFHDVFTALENTLDQHFVRFETTGWEKVLVDYELVPAGPLDCWQFQNPINRDVILATNAGISGNTYETKVANVPIQFRTNYVVEVVANSMTSEAFAYWSEAKRQLNRGGGIFDPPFAPVIGNIRNVNDPTEAVLGYFHAYSQDMTRYCYSRDGIPVQFEIPVFPIGVTTLCTEHYAPALFELPFDEGVCP
ncbi:MAG: DUF4249 domain-containing protein [Cytophagales bacterium]|nr:DUF4249 domain-containing protein [Cytophagales bacterium]